MLHYTTLQYTTIHYTNYATPQLQLQLQLHYTNYTTLQLLLKTTTPLHYNYNYTYNYNYNCTTPQYIQQLWWGDHCNHCSHSRKHNSNHLLVHHWIRSAIRDSQQPTSPIGFLFLKLPPPPCAVLLVMNAWIHEQFGKANDTPIIIESLILVISHLTTIKPTGTNDIPIFWGPVSS